MVLAARMAGAAPHLDLGAHRHGCPRRPRFGAKRGSPAGFVDTAVGLGVAAAILLKTWSWSGTSVSTSPGLRTGHDSCGAHACLDLGQGGGVEPEGWSWPGPWPPSSARGWCSHH